MPTRAQELAAEVNAVLGAGTVKMGSDPDFEVTFLPTGCAPIDYIFQGGLPRGRFTEVFGDYSTLKTYVGLKAIATTQQNGGTAALIDTEHAYDRAWAKQIGVDVDSLIVPPVQTGEDAVDAAEVLIRKGVDLIIFDSVAATLPKAEHEMRLGGEKNIQPARLAALMSVLCRKLNAANTRTALMFINQTRANVGVMFGSNETTPGGKSLPFYASYRVAFRKAGSIKRDAKTYDGEKFKSIKETTAQRIRVTIEKSKLNRPWREIYFDFDLTTASIDETGFLLNLAVERGIVQTAKGMWWFKGGTKKSRGKAAFLAKTTPQQLKKKLGMDEVETEPDLADIVLSPGPKLRRRS